MAGIGSSGRPNRILIVSASMGAGHEGAALELVRRLTARGQHAESVDFLGLVPFRLGPFVRWLYRMQLQHAAWTYEVTYRLQQRTPRVARAVVVRVVSVLTARPLARVVRAAAPDVIVSTYPFSSLVLGRLRTRGRLTVPVATFLTDFAVHPLWVHPGVDVHLAVSEASAAAARSAGGTRSVMTGPIVPPADHRSPDRAATRAGLGIDPDARVVLVVAGSWGVGEIEETVTAIEHVGDASLIVVCGRDEVLRARLSARGVRGVVLGWTDRMDALMHAADVMVENAGGLTTMEAFRAGLTVVSYRPIAGHGRDNARTMAAAGVTRYPTDDAALALALDDAATPGPARDDQLAAARALFAADAADEVVALATAPRAAVRSRASGPRRVAVAAAAVVVTFGVLTEGAEALAARGMGVAKPPASATAVYLGIRADAGGISDPRVTAALRSAHASLVVDAHDAVHASAMLRSLTAAHGDVENGGGARGALTPWSRARGDCTRSATTVARAAGARPRALVATSAPDAFYQAACRFGRHHERIVMPDSTFTTRHIPASVIIRHIYELDVRGAHPAAAALAIDAFADRAAAAGLTTRPYRDLQ